jgi:hypothetical protein
VALVVSGTPGIATEGSTCGWLVDLALLLLVAVPLPLLVVVLGPVLAAAADEFAAPESAGTPGIAALATDNAEVDPAEPDAPALPDEPDARDKPDPPELDELEDPDEAAETPGIAAIASVT